MNVQRKRHIYSYAVLAILLLELSPMLLAASGCDGVGNCYVYASATGTGTGSNWTRAYTGFGTGARQVNPASMLRGVTYWIAAGNYGSVRFSTPASGTLVTTIKAATTSNHGPATDWNNSYAGQALFSESDLTTSYWNFDGQSRGSDWQTGYNIKFWNQTHPQGKAFYINANSTWHNPVVVTDVAFRYVEIEGTNKNFTSSTSCANGGYCDQGFYIGSPTNNVYIGFCYLHDVGDTQVQANLNASGTNRLGDNYLFEYNYFSRNHSGAQSSDNHSEAFSITASNLIIRNNYFQDIGSSAVITDAAGGNQAFGNWYVYGNAWFWTNANPYPGVGNGFVAFYGQTLSGVVQVYNNTIANINNATCSVCNSAALGIFDGGQGGNRGSPMISVYNNLWWNPYRGSPTSVASGSYSVTADYNESYGGNFTKQGSHDSTTKGNPFTKFNGSGYSYPRPFESLGFKLTADTARGLAISGWSTSPSGCTSGINCFNIDPAGVIRGADGTIDRGAFQIGSSRTVNAPRT